MKERRVLVTTTGKGGAIMFYEALYKLLHFTEEEIAEKIKILKETLKDGYYLIDETGCHYKGNS